MAYEKTVWQNGDTITAEKLNKLEDGVQTISEGSDFIINLQWDDNESKYIMDKDFEEINNAYDSGIKLKANIEGFPYLDFMGRDVSMVGYTYEFTGVSSYGSVTTDPTYVPSLIFQTAFIDNNQIRVNRKTVSLNFDTNN